jgi:hypothetical protein
MLVQAARVLKKAGKVIYLKELADNVRVRLKAVGVLK